MKRFWDKVAVTAFAEDCWLWTGATNRKGPFAYGSFSYDGKTTGAHRVAYMLTYGELPHNAFVRHKCDVPLCCNPGHLEIGTPRENAMDCIVRKRAVRALGSRHARSRFTEKEAYEIKKLAAFGLACSDIGRIYGCHEGTIKHVARRGWKHLDPAITAALAVACAHNEGGER